MGEREGGERESTVARPRRALMSVHSALRAACKCAAALATRGKAGGREEKRGRREGEEREKRGEERPLKGPFFLSPLFSLSFERRNGVHWTTVDRNGPHWTAMDRNGPQRRLFLIKLKTAIRICVEVRSASCSLSLSFYLFPIV